MRTARKKLKGTGCYYHLMNRTAGVKGDRPFNEVTREHGMKLAMRLSEYYLLEFISMCWMGNHFHIVLYAPYEDELPPLSDIATRHNLFYGEESPKYIDPKNTNAVTKIAERMIDISRFMKDYQQTFTRYFNKNHDRRGHLWADRFKSVILEGREALWTAVKYVELNPVRSGVIQTPADYRHCTWGWREGSGTHPFATSFAKHLRRSLGDLGSNLSDDNIFKRFNSELARTIAYESGLVGNDITSEMNKAKRRESMPIRFLRHTRHWTDGGIIGSKAFVKEIACHFRTKTYVDEKRFSHGKMESGVPLYCFKRLRLTGTIKF